jgi:hypothetical protein
MNIPVPCLFMAGECDISQKISMYKYKVSLKPTFPFEALPGDNSVVVLVIEPRLRSGMVPQLYCRWNFSIVDGGMLPLQEMSRPTFSRGTWVPMPGRTRVSSPYFSYTLPGTLSSPVGPSSNQGARLCCPSTQQSCRRAEAAPMFIVRNTEILETPEERSREEVKNNHTKNLALGYLD